MITTNEAAQTGASRTTRFLALDITRMCQAQCAHCYNSSGPSGTDGDMTRDDWLGVLDQAADLGVNQIQFIGGEATLHPDLPELVNRAVDQGMAVEVFSNLIHIRPEVWCVLRRRGVTLATSYYSDRADEHERITKRRGSYAKTKANIIRALDYGIPVRAALVDMREGQRSEEAQAELRALGVTSIRTDRMRGIGRGAETGEGQDPAELCGNCTRGRAAVMPNGDVAGCVMSAGMMTAGNVHGMRLADILDSQAWRNIAVRVPTLQANGACAPDSCTPKEDSCQPSPGVDPWEDFRATACNPNSDGSDCSPAETPACNPKY
ncbi:radical SAM/SPASM domain-containing protein [Streptacidiphilus sp. PB12-B1b]|uniref:radical SAM/SPASM domain-containing protein n=1 Tax=Streptacidiphilus sp. PB12-B1b TaxID=2705012 RepID=UPI001CDBF7BD|nr:radical SAM/SPASM domain-containing protein [Streptacidiphilus sp. PB12-B1b]